MMKFLMLRVSAVSSIFLLALTVAPASAATAVTLQAPGSPVQDVTIRGGSYAATNEEGGLLATRLSSDPTYTRRALLDFDTQSKIPAGSTILSATLTLTVHWGGSDASRRVGVYALNTPFVASQATWDVASATTPWRTPGGDLGTRYASVSVTNKPGAAVSFDVASLVQAQLRASGAHHVRMELVDVDSLSNARAGYRDYYSSEASSSSVRPRLVITIGSSSSGGGSAAIPRFSHVFVIVMENHEYSQIIGSSAAPFTNSLARQYGLLTDYTAVTHPSLPNYMALTGGRTVFTSDCSGCTTSARSVVDEAVDSGRTWKAYMESMPAVCTTTDSGQYVQKHDPFIHYTDVVGDTPRCDHHVVPMTSLSSDLASGSVANYVWITPNTCHDMHDCSVATGDAWLSKMVPQITSSPAFANSVLFLLWDEGTTNVGGGGQVAAVVVSPWTPAGLRWAGQANHYSLLRTIEDAWGLSPLGNSANATALTGLFTGR
jgi:acid phosphatase